MLSGTSVEAKVSRVVDGDTIRVFLPNSNEDESLRILSLDTEESRAGGGKPVTPWGKEAKKRANEFFKAGDTVQLEFPGNEDIEICLKKHRGNYGRLLVYVYKDSIDFQETMIREGYSPYFTKYGRAVFGAHDQRYTNAERDAQKENIGIWNQIEVNGSEIRNYAALGIWWHLRASIIDKYRNAKMHNDSLLNTRLDYEKIIELSQANETVTVFTELRTIQRVGVKSAAIDIGSMIKPFSIFLPNIENINGEQIINLLNLRYIHRNNKYPQRSYAYVTGKLSFFQNRPQLTPDSADSFSDNPPD